MGRASARAPPTGGDSKRWRLVQFHPSYGYEDFIEGLRPVVDKDGKIELFGLDADE